MTDLYVSVAVLVCAVLLSEALRRAAARLPPGTGSMCLLEAASTFQLCCCSHELKLLAGSTRLPTPVSLSLTYIMTATHLRSFRGATCNPCGVVERLCRGSGSVAAASLLIACQFAAALVARSAAAAVWSLALSDAHLRHQKFGFRCFDPLGGSVPEAAAVELLCAFTVQAAAAQLRGLDETLRLHGVSAVVTALVYTGGDISGAVFNPVLAFSMQFPCSGHTYLEYCFIYWLGPALGVASCILLFEKIIPFLSGKSGVREDVPVVDKQKTQ